MVFSTYWTFPANPEEDRSVKAAEIANRDRENGRRRIIRISKEKERRRRRGFLLSSRHRTFMRSYENVPTPTSKVLFSFSYVPPLFSLPRHDSSFSPSRYLRLLRAPVLLLSLLTYVHTSVERSRFITVLALEYGCRGGIMSA